MASRGETMSTENNSGNMATASTDKDVAQGVQTLKALSLNGLNKNLSHSTSASQDLQSMPSDNKGRPHPLLSWGDVTEIPNGAAGKTHEYVKHPIVPSSSSTDPWQVRSTQNPSKPLVRRPTPMAIRVPKSVLEKGSKIITGSFEEEDEDEDNDEEQMIQSGNESPVPVSLKPGTNSDVLVIEDVETPSPEIATPKDRPLGLVVEGRAIDHPADVGSPTIVVRTDIGEELSQEQAEELEDDEGADDGDEEEDEFDVEDKQFLSPTASKTASFGKNPDPPSTNSHVQTVSHQPRVFVRRQTPIKLDLPKNLKELMTPNTSEGIMEEEEEEEEADDKLSEGNRDSREVSSGTNNETSSNEPKLNNINSLDTRTGAEIIAASDVKPDESSKKDNNAEISVPGRPDIITSVNCNNNNHETPSLDLVEGAQDTLRSQVEEVLKQNEQQTMSPTTQSPTQRRSLFKKSTSGPKSGSSSPTPGSPSSARRKVSAHHTKILKRQLTPLEIEMPRHVISDDMKKRSATAFEEDEEEES